MLRYKNEGIAISVKLPKTDYIARILGNWNNKTKSYNCSVELKGDDIDKYILIDELSTTISSEPKDIKINMAKYITELYEQEKFKDAIASYEFENKCFDTGIDVLETQKSRGFENV